MEFGPWRGVGGTPREAQSPRGVTSSRAAAATARDITSVTGLPTQRALRVLPGGAGFNPIEAELAGFPGRIPHDRGDSPAKGYRHGVPGDELDSNAAERGMQNLALGRKVSLFVGSEAGGKAAAVTGTLIETARLNTVDPRAWLAATLARVPHGKITRVDDLLPCRWNREPSDQTPTLDPCCERPPSSVTGVVFLGTALDWIK